MEKGTRNCEPSVRHRLAQLSVWGALQKALDIDEIDCKEDDHNDIIISFMCCVRFYL